MTEACPPFDTFLDELKASLSQPSGKAVLRRINAERLLSLVANELIAGQEGARVRILPDSRLVGEAGADFLLQIDDYDIRLELLDAPQDELALDATALPSILDLLQDNPSTVAVVLAWTTDELLAVPLSAVRVRYLMLRPDRLPDLAAMAKPLLDVLRNLVSQQTKAWHIGLTGAPQVRAKRADTRGLFEQSITAAIEAERRRSYRHIERKLAARQFPVNDEIRAILAVLGQALEGATANELVPSLTHIARRGKR